MITSFPYKNQLTESFTLAETRGQGPTALSTTPRPRLCSPLQVDIVEGAVVALDVVKVELAAETRLIDDRKSTHLQLTTQLTRSMISNSILIDLKVSIQAELCLDIL